MNADEVSPPTAEIIALPPQSHFDPIVFQWIEEYRDELQAKLKAGSTDAETVRKDWKRIVDRAKQADLVIFNHDIPTAYRNTTPLRARDPKAFAEVINYPDKGTRHSRHNGKPGLVLYGESGSGKTHAAYGRIIQRALTDGAAVIGHISATELSELVRESTYNAKQYGLILRLLKGNYTDEDLERADGDSNLHRFISIEGLLIDDIHIPKLTPAYAQALYSIVEGQTSSGNELIITTQLTGTALLEKLCGDNPDLRDTAIAIIRRISDHCHPVKFEAKAGP